MKHTMISVAVVMAIAAMPEHASASGFAIGTQNASGLGNAYAGAGAAAEDASTIFYNPAGLTRLGGRQLVVAGNLLKPSNKFSNNGSTVPAPLPLGGLGDDAGDFALVPVTYLSWQVNPAITVGLGVNAPFGLTTEYESGWMGRFHALKSQVKAINVNPTIAFKASEAVSIGFGINYQRFAAELTNSFNYFGAGVGGCIPQPACQGPTAAAIGAQREGVAKVKGHDGSWGWNAGVMFSPGPNTRIGLAYRSAIKFTLAGQVTFGNRPAALAGTLPDSDIRADVKTPASFGFNIAHQINPRWQILADLTWTEWSNLQELRVVRTSGATLSTLDFRWKDTWRAGLGLNYRPNDAWTIRFGIARDESPTNDEHRTPRLPDQDRTWIAIGAQYRISKQGVIDFGYAHEFIKDAAINLVPPNVSAQTAALNGRLVGKFDNKVDIFGVQYRHSF